MGSSSAAYGGAGGSELGSRLACPRDPAPLAARGLAAVLARAGCRGRRGLTSSARPLLAPMSDPRVGNHQRQAATVHDTTLVFSLSTSLPVEGARTALLW